MYSGFVAFLKKRGHCYNKVSKETIERVQKIIEENAQILFNASDIWNRKESYGTVA